MRQFRDRGALSRPSRRLFFSIESVSVAPNRLSNTRVHSCAPLRQFVDKEKHGPAERKQFPRARGPDRAPALPFYDANRWNHGDYAQPSRERCDCGITLPAQRMMVLHALLRGRIATMVDKQQDDLVLGSSARPWPVPTGRPSTRRSTVNAHPFMLMVMAIFHPLGFTATTVDRSPYSKALA